MDEIMTSLDIGVCPHGYSIIFVPTQRAWSVNGATPLTVQDVENATCVCAALKRCTKVSVLAGASSLSSNGQPFVIRDRLVAMTDAPGLVRVRRGGSSVALASLMAHSLAALQSSAPQRPAAANELQVVLRVDRGELPVEALPAFLYVIVTIVQGERTFQTELLISTQAGTETAVATTLSAEEEAWGVISTSLLQSRWDDWEPRGVQSFVSFSPNGGLEPQEQSKERWKQTYDEMLSAASGDVPTWRAVAAANRLPANAHTLPKGVLVRLPLRLQRGDVIVLKPRFPVLAALAAGANQLQRTIETWNVFDRSNLDGRLLLAWFFEQLAQVDETSRAVDRGAGEVVYDTDEGFRGARVKYHRPLYRILLDQHDVERRKALAALQGDIDRLRQMLDEGAACESDLLRECHDLALATPSHPRFCVPSLGSNLRLSAHPATVEDIPAKILLDATQQLLTAETLCERYRRCGRPPRDEPIGQPAWGERHLSFLRTSPAIGLLQGSKWLVETWDKVSKLVDKTSQPATFVMAKRVEQTVLLAMQFSQRYGLAVSWVREIYEDLVNVQLFDDDGKPIVRGLADEISLSRPPASIVGRIDADVAHLRRRLGGLAGSLGLIVLLGAWLEHLEKADGEPFPALADSQDREYFKRFSETLGLLEIGSQLGTIAVQKSLAKPQLFAFNEAALTGLQRHMALARVGVHATRLLGVAGIAVSLAAGSADLKRGDGWRAASWYTQASLAALAMVPGVAVWPVLLASIALPLLLEYLHVSDEEQQLEDLIRQTEFGRDYLPQIHRQLGGTAEDESWRRSYYRLDTRAKPAKKGLPELRHRLHSLRWRCWSAKVRSPYSDNHGGWGVVLQLAHRLESGPGAQCRVRPPRDWYIPAVSVSSVTRPDPDGEHLLVSLRICTDTGDSNSKRPLNSLLYLAEPPVGVKLSRQGSDERVLVIFAGRDDAYSCELELKVRPGEIQTMVIVPSLLLRPPDPPANGPVMREGDPRRQPLLLVTDCNGMLADEERDAPLENFAKVRFHDLAQVDVDLP